MKGNYSSSFGHLIGSESLLIYTDSDTSSELNISNFFTGESNKWIHIVQTFNGDQITVYKNSQTNNNYKNASGITLTTNLNALYIGNNSGSNYFLDGFMDNVRIYDSVLTTSQIKQNYIAGLNSLLANNNISQEEYNQRLDSLSQND